MAAPDITSSNCTNSGSDSQSSYTWDVSFPAWEAGDLIIFHAVAGSKNVTSLTKPTLPDGEAWTTLTNGYFVQIDGVPIWIAYFVAGGARSATTRAFTANTYERWTATVVKVPAGEFNATTPLGAYAVNGVGASTSSVSTAAFSVGASDGGGRLCAWLGINQDPVTGTPAGWTDQAMVDRGVCVGCLSTRTADTEDSEAIPSYSWTIALDEYSSCVYVVHGSIEPALKLRAVLEQPYHLSGGAVRAVLEQIYYLTTRQINTLVQVYGLRILAMLVQPYGNMPQFRTLLDQRYGDCFFLRRLIEHEYGDAPQYRAELVQEWAMPEALRAMLEQRYHIADSQLRGLCEQVYDLFERDRVKAILDQLYVLAAGDAIVQVLDLAIVAETDGDNVAISSAFNINIEQDDALYHMTGELQLADQAEYLACRKLARGVVPSSVVVTIDGEEYHYIVEDKRTARGAGGNIYAVILASPSLLLGHKDSDYSLVSASSLSGMASQLVTALAAPV